MTWELRWHPFREEWVLFTAHRGTRPGAAPVSTAERTTLTGHHTHTRREA